MFQLSREQRSALAGLSVFVRSLNKKRFAARTARHFFFHAAN
jgi:hypothetical protein